MHNLILTYSPNSCLFQLLLCFREYAIGGARIFAEEALYCISRIFDAFCRPYIWPIPSEIK